MKSPDLAAAASNPDYVTSLQAAYGAPSDEGFGSAVFFVPGAALGNIEEIARTYYQHFVGKKWQEWGPDNWLRQWREIYRRQAGAGGDVIAELGGIQDAGAKMQVGMILDSIEKPEDARKALSEAYDHEDVLDLRAYKIGDGGAMSGLLLVGARANGDVTILTFLMD